MNSKQTKLEEVRQSDLKFIVNEYWPRAYNQLRTNGHFKHLPYYYA